MTKWYEEERREARRFGWLTAKWVIVAVAFAVLLGAGLFWLNVAVSKPVGQGQAIAEKNSAENWTAAQARFEDLYADIVATDRKIGVAFTAWQGDTADKTLEQTYLGTVTYCLEVVGDYNAEARKFLAADFRAADLPPQIDDLDPATDCKE